MFYSERNIIMQEFDVNILKRNVNDLLRNNHVTQQQLADAIGSIQSNVSKALSLKDKKCFTVEQIFAIADYFGVSIDWLVGYETARKKTVSQKAIAAFVAELLENGTMKSAAVTIEEEVYTSVINSHGFPDSESEKKKVVYNSLFFPDYWYPSDRAHDEVSMDEFALEMFQDGNETKNFPLNEFLGKYLSILALYKKGQLSEEPYRIVLKDYLAQLDDL